MPDREYKFCKTTMDKTWFDLEAKGKKTILRMVQVRSERTRKIAWYRHADDLHLWPGDQVVMETERGTTLGVVRSIPAKRWTVARDLQSVLRKVDKNSSSWQEARTVERQDKAASICRELAAGLKLDMKLIDVEYVPWENRTVFYFVAEGRVDFRELVKELSRSLRCRIEMRQIGPRDETKIVGGAGRCGRDHCCTSYLTEFRSVRTKMAKEQGLVVNQEKITGHCRKLLCCLAYEREVYSRLKEDMPRIGVCVKTIKGIAHVVEVHLMRQLIKVRLDEAGTVVEYPASAFQPVKDAPEDREAVQYNVEEVVKPVVAEHDFLPASTTEKEPGSGESRKQDKSGSRRGSRRRRSRSDSTGPAKQKQEPRAARTDAGQSQANRKDGRRQEPRKTGDEKGPAKSNRGRRRRRGGRGKGEAPKSTT
jgi:cell fate regulator YaaT (PSP1 superfamily)